MFIHVICLCEFHRLAKCLAQVKYPSIYVLYDNVFRELARLAVSELYNQEVLIGRR